MLTPSHDQALSQTDSSSSFPLRQDETQIHLPEFMPFFWLGCAAIAGTLFAEKVSLPWYYWVTGALAGLIIGIFQVRIKAGLPPKRKLPLAVVFACACLAAMLYAFSLPKNTASEVQYYNDKGEVELTGIIILPPDQQQNGIALTVRVESLRPLGIPNRGDNVTGKVLVQAQSGLEYHYGDRISVKGELTVPAEGSSFSYRTYLAHQGIYSVSRFSTITVLEHNQGNPLLAAIYSLRDRSITVLNNIFPNPENSLLRGILIGDESGISTELQQAYSLTGTAHIIAISGFNMAILAGLVTRLFSKGMGALKGGLLSILVLAVYTLLVGASASVVRAAVMGSYAILGSLIARRGNVLNSLGLCVLLMVLFNPHVAWDVGFQLSVMATLGLALYATPLQARLTSFFTKRFGEETAARLGSPVSEYFLITLIAQIMVLPFLLYHFREVSPLFLLANPLVLPVQPLVMILGLASLAAGLLSMSLGRFLSWLAWPFAAYTNRIVTFLASLWPNVWRFPSFSFFWVLLYFFAFFYLTLHGTQKSKEKLQIKPAFVLIGLASCGLLLWSIIAFAPDGRLHLRVLGNTEQPVVLIRTPAGRYMLVGGSLPANSLAQNVSQALPPTIRELDILLIPNCGKKDVSGLFGLTSQVRLGRVIWACDPHRLQTTWRLYQSMDEEGINQERLQINQAFDLGQGTLAVPTISDEKLVSLLLTRGDFKARILFEEDASVGLDKIPLIIASTLPESTARSDSLIPTVYMLSQTEISSSWPKTIIFEPLLYNDYAWLEASTDGNNLWLRGFK